jgi:formylglycine-generating enzyme required for sulfatase activity
MNSPIRNLSLTVLFATAMTYSAIGAQQPPAAPAQGAPARATAAPAAPAAPVKIEYLKIAAGEFMMGCSKGDTTCDMHDPKSPISLAGLFKDLSETPAHMVKITKPFEMAKYVVTQGEWKMVMGTDLSTFKGDNLPMENISWNQIQDFLTKTRGYQSCQCVGPLRHAGKRLAVGSGCVQRL